MGDFRRQPSKVWWSTYEDEDFPNYSNHLGWGKGVDLSGNFNESSVNNNSNHNLSVKNNLSPSKVDKSQTRLSTKLDNVEEKKEENEDDDEDKENKRKSLESDRGSPSQGSHKSQDSGFSDSEIQTNALSLSPQCSPELSARLSCTKCKSREEIAAEQADLSQKEKTYNETVVNYRKLKTSVKTTQFKLIEFNPETYNEPPKQFLETAFETPVKDATKDETGAGTSPSPKDKNRRSLFVSPVSRTKSEKINQIQNQLELSFKLPKTINLPQNIKIPNIFQSKQNDDLASTGGRKTKPKESIPSVKSLPCINSSGSLKKKRENGERDISSSLDSEGFKVPKLPLDQSFASRGTTNHLLDFTDIEGPPVSCSTPKSNKFQGRESPVPRAARASEKKFKAKTTFAKIRKLKGLSEKAFKSSTSLLEPFNRSASTGSVSCGKAKIHIDHEASVKQWLSELETMYEAEIMTTLQSKSLATDLTRQVTNMADTTSFTVKKLHQKTKIISLEFSKLCKQNKNKVDKHIGPLVQSLVGHITEFIREYVQKPSNQRNVRENQREEANKCKKEEPERNDELITDFRKPEPETVEMSPRDAKIKSKDEEVLDVCENLRNLSSQSKCDHEKIEEEVALLGKKFREVVDGLLEGHIQALVRVLEEPKTELALRTALSALTTLGLEGYQLSEVVSRCGGIRALLAVCLEARATAIRIAALRAITTVCCISNTIRQFEQAGGVEIIADILADENRSEAELSEASAVIAQITAPWVQDNHSVEGLSQFLNSLVTSLTRIVRSYKSCETLLLSSAALANLTFMEPRTVWPLLENGTAKILLSAVRQQGSKVSIFIQEQAATIIANMSSVPECRKHLAEQRAVVALLCFLEIPHSPLQSAPEVAAAERVLQKSAIALSRLCSDLVVAKQVIELQGVNRLVRLCKEEKERNHSDGVLVACLAALRKIVANCGNEALEELNALELVEPRLLDSFLLYSSKQESYV